MTGVLTRLSLLLPGVLLLASLTSGFSASNAVPPTQLGFEAQPINANALKPPECAGLNLTTLVVGSGTVTGKGGGSLVLGSPGNDTLRGLGGTDCLLGGGGNDTMRGEGGVDVCIGGPGTDTFHNTCDTQIQ